MPFDPEQFGVRPHDEGLHAFDETDPSWNESVFFDWVHDERFAGHIRIGRMPGQGRVWVWIHVLQEGEWVVLEHPFVPIARFSEFDVNVPGLVITREVITPLRTLRVRAEAVGRVTNGPRAGRLVPFAFDLTFEGAGPVHSIGESFVAGHASEISTSRYEQPMDVRGTQRVGDVTHTLSALGERDHSWGPRDWNIAWTFLPVSRPDLRALAIRVSLDEDSFMDLGYLHGTQMGHVFEIEFDLAYADDPLHPHGGRVKLVDEHGTVLEGVVTALTGTEIDLSHVVDGTRPSVYRRALVKLEPADGSAPLLGFLEVHRFVDSGKAGAT